MSTIEQVKVGTVFTVPEDNDDVIYTVRENGIIGESRGVTSEPIDRAEFSGVELKIQN
jgi:hypothetical protein